MTDREAAEKPIDALFAKLEQSELGVLMLDYDGTLAPFRVDPADAFPYPGIVETLDALMENGRTRVVLITGRRARELEPLLGTRAMPEVWGSHGWERLFPTGALSIVPAPKSALRVLTQASGDADAALRMGARIERKPSSLALHWRGLPQERASQVRTMMQERWSALCETGELSLLEFDGGIELRIVGRTKADAVLTVMQECEPQTPAAFLGDDVTDEDAFVALRGKALTALVRQTPRPTAAQVWLQPPEELAVFLQRWQRARQTFRSSREH
jgi:trehalose 6-phosphate phosphatase